jgi:RNA polymerase sigma factor (sigma-70 family)
MDELDRDFELAFDELFGRAFAMAHRLLGNVTAAEDVAAEACARAYAHWKRIGQLAYRDGWVLRVASNLAIDALRRNRHELRTTVDASTEDTVALRLALAAALQALPRRQRETVVLRYIAGLKEREVADVLGVSTGSVKTHVSRGLARLRAQLGEGFFEEATHAH